MESENSTDSDISKEVLILRPNLNKSKHISQYEAEEKVFGNPMLLEEILKYLVFNTNAKISQNIVQTTRLVRKSWLKTTSALMKKSVKPFIEITLHENNSLSGSDYGNQNGKRLDQFVSRFGSSSRLQDSLLPFKLNLTVAYFHEENQRSLINCLTRLGNELIEIHVMFPKDGGSMPLIFPSLTLPFLKSLSFQFSATEYVNRREDQESNSFGSNKNGLWLLQLLLNASVDLQTLTIPWSTSKDDLVPKNFEMLQLPSSITSISLKQTLKREGVEVLLNNQLPNLEQLVIRLQKIPLEKDMLFKILDRFRKTLKMFQVGGATVNVSSHSSTFIKLPLMEKLETLRINSTKCELETESASSVQIFLPKLKDLWLTYQTEAFLAKWLQNSKFEGVKTLVLCVVDDELRQPHPDYFLSISLELMEQVHAAFPNVIHLQLTVNISDMSSLTYLFKNMVQLQTLTIDLRGNIGEAYKYLIGSILLGIPVRLVKALTLDIEYFHSFQLKRDPSILNLSALTVLTFWTIEHPGASDHFSPEKNESVLLSDLVFNEGFLRMPKLAYLKLTGKYQVSKRMAEVWTSLGREMIFNKSN